MILMWTSRYFFTQSSVLIALFLWMPLSTWAQETGQSIIVPEVNQVGELEKTVADLNSFLASFRLEVQSDKDATNAQLQSLESGFNTMSAAANAQNIALVENSETLNEHELEIQELSKMVKRLQRRLSNLRKRVRDR